MEKTRKGEFVELEFTGYHDGKPFDSNIEEDLKKIHPDAKSEKTIVIIGEGMVIPGLDKALEEKEIGKQYNLSVSPKDGFGERKRDFVKTIPLKIFRAKNIDPQPGAAFYLDNMLARVIAVSGARVITDFNNPLAGKELEYKFKILRVVKEEKEKTQAFFKFFFRFEPEFDIEDKKIVVKGTKNLEVIVNIMKDKFKNAIGKELVFEIKEEKEAKNETKKDN